jgi:hypothetical protein
MKNPSLFLYHPGDEVILKKPHPCTTRSARFLIVKIGADIKVKCLGCGGMLMMTRDHFNQRIKETIPHQK